MLTSELPTISLFPAWVLWMPFIWCIYGIWKLNEELNNGSLVYGAQ